MNSNIVHVRRDSDGKVMDIPERHLDETLKRGFTLVDMKVEEILTQVEQVEVSNKLECPLCDKVFKMAWRLETHKKSHYADEENQS